MGRGWKAGSGGNMTCIGEGSVEVTKYKWRVRVGMGWIGVMRSGGEVVGGLAVYEVMGKEERG